MAVMVLGFVISPVFFFFFQVGEVVNTLCGYKTLHQQVSGISEQVCIHPMAFNQPLPTAFILRNTHSHIQ